MDSIYSTPPSPSPPLGPGWPSKGTNKQTNKHQCAQGFKYAARSLQANFCYAFCYDVPFKVLNNAHMATGPGSVSSLSHRLRSECAIYQATSGENCPLHSKRF